VGVILPLSGSLSDYGVAIKNGIELYQYDHPDKTKSVEFLYEDDQYDSKTSISAYKKLSTIDNVDLYISFGSPSCTSLAPILERDKKLLINLSADEVPALGRKYVFRSVNHTGQYMKELIAYLASISVTETGILAAELGFTESMLSAYKRNLLPDQHVLELGTVNPRELDFRTLVLKAKLKNVTTIGLFLKPEQIIVFLRQAAELKYKPMIFGANTIESALLLPKHEVLEGAIYPYHNLTTTFMKRYEEKFGGNISQLPFAGNAYDMADILFSSDGRFKDPESLLDYFASVKDHDGIMGKFSYTEDAEGGKYFKYPIFIKKVKDGVGEMLNW